MAPPPAYPQKVQYSDYYGEQPYQPSIPQRGPTYIVTVRLVNAMDFLHSHV
jgi:hypothetical protein